MNPSLGKRSLAECVGTALLVAIGTGAIVLSARVGGVPQWELALAWFFAVLVPIVLFARISGAHLNPAVTLALAFRRRFPWASVVPYWIAQIVGAFFAAALVMWVYHDAIAAYNTAAHLVPSAGNALATYSIFATFPAAYFHGSIGGPFLDEAVGTALLVVGIFAVTDARNSAPTSNLGPLIVGFVVFAVGTSFGANTGYAINPARDFGPRLFAFIAGYGQVALPGTFNNGAGFSFSDYFWIPIIGPLLGGCVGAIVYDFFIGDVLHARKSRTGAADAVPEEIGRSESNVQPDRA